MACLDCTVLQERNFVIEVKPHKKGLTFALACQFLGHFGGFLLAGMREGARIKLLESWGYLFIADVILNTASTIGVLLIDTNELHLQRDRPVGSIKVEETCIGIYAQEAGHIGIVWQCG